MVQQLVQHIVHSLVEHKGAVRVTEQTKDSARVIVISVEKSDVGRIIGKDGQTIKAIRSLVFSILPDEQISDVIIDES